MDVLFDDTDIEDGSEPTSPAQELVDEAREFAAPAPAEAQEPVVEEESAPAPAPVAPAAPTALQVPPVNLAEPVEVEGVTLSANEVRELMRQNAVLLQEAHNRKVEEAGEAALARGVAPIVVQMAKQILSATSPTANATITLGLPQEDGSQRETVVNLFDAVANLLKQVPGRITEEPLSYQFGTEEQPNRATPDNPYLSDAEMTPEEAEEWAKKERETLGLNRRSPGAQPAEI